MDMQISGARLGQKPFDRRFEITSVHELATDHHRAGVERAHRERADAQLFRYLISPTSS